MKNVNGFTLKEIRQRLNYDSKSGLKVLLIFSPNKIRLIALSRKARKIGLILSLFLICNSSLDSINNFMVLAVEKRANTEFVSIGRDKISVARDLRSPNATNVYRAPFILRHNIIWVEAIVNEKKGLLMLDTGTDMLVLNQNHFRGSLTNDYISGVTIDMEYSQRKHVKLQISNLPVHAQYAFIADLDHLEKNLQMEILGICGIDFLQKFQWVIHYHQRFIEFFTLDKSGNLMGKPTQPPPGETLQLQKKSGLLLIKVQIDGLPMNLALDTGTSSTVFNKKYKNRLLTQNNQLKQLQQASKIIGIVGSRELITSFALYDLQIGHTTVPPIQVSFLSLYRINSVRNVKIDGMFNPLYLCHGTIGINWKKKQLYVWKAVPKQQKSVVVGLDK